MVGALRRLATDEVVMNASVNHVMYVGLTMTARAAGARTGRSAGTSIEAMSHLHAVDAATVPRGATASIIPIG
jgi:hypothetical protein